MSQPHGDVSTSFAFHFFSSGCDLFLSNYFPCRDIKVMSRHPFLLLSSSLGCNLNGWSRHHFSCQDFSSCFHVATCIACCDFFYLRRPLLLLHRQILVATSKLCCDIIYLLLVLRHRNDVATCISSLDFASSSLDHVFFVATSFFTSRLRLFKFQFLIQIQICCCRDLDLLETELPVATSIFSHDLNSVACWFLLIFA